MFEVLPKICASHIWCVCLCLTLYISGFLKQRSKLQSHDSGPFSIAFQQNTPKSSNSAISCSYIYLLFSTHTVTIKGGGGDHRWEKVWSVTSISICCVSHSLSINMIISTTMQQMIKLIRRRTCNKLLHVMMIFTSAILILSTLPLKLLYSN